VSTKKNNIGNVWNCEDGKRKKRKIMGKREIKRRGKYEYGIERNKRKKQKMKLVINVNGKIY